MTFTGKYRNYTVYIILGITIVSMVVALILADRDDARFTSNYQLFSRLNNLMQQGQANAAKPLVEQLLRNQPNSYILLWDYALIQEAQGNFADAVNYFERTRRERPFIVNDPWFLSQYAQALIFTKQYDRAQIYLSRAKQFSTDPGLTKSIESLESTLQSRR